MGIKSRPSEYKKVEKPFIEQLEKQGWTFLEGDTEIPSFSERDNFRDVILEKRLREAIKKINLDENGNEWLDDLRINEAVTRLLRLEGHKLIEKNTDATTLLITGTEVDDLEGSPKTIQYIDFENPDNNDFLVMNQFRVNPLWRTSGKGHIIPDIVLFVNGIPLVVIECKAPDIDNPMFSAINQLMRYSDQRQNVTIKEGAEQLFRYTQIMIASSYYQTLVGTICSSDEYYLEWKDPYPETKEGLKTSLGISSVTSQHVTIEGMLHPHKLLDILLNFTLFTEINGTTIKIIPRYQQYRAVQKMVEGLVTRQTRLEHGESDQRGGIIWHTQGSGKSLSMVFLVRKMRTMVKLRKFRVVIITDRKDLEKQLSETADLTGEPLEKARGMKRLRKLIETKGAGLVFGLIQKFRGDTLEDTFTTEILPELNEDESILVLIDEAHRSHSSVLHANLMNAMPNCAKIGFTGTPIIQEGKKHTHEIFGPFIDKYTIVQSQEDGCTVPILYEGRTTNAEVKDGDTLDNVFFDYFKERTEKERAIIKRKYGTVDRVLEAPDLIKSKAKNMLEHYVSTILPNEMKAQVVAVSRLAAVRYQSIFEEVRDELVKEIQEYAKSQETQVNQTDRTKFLSEAVQYLNTIQEIKFATVISEKHNQDSSWKSWTASNKQKGYVSRFKKPLKEEKLAFLIVNRMLLVGFDAPVEQVMYLDRRMRDHELLQAIARVNRRYENKTHGLVVDYFGVAEHLKEALDVYTNSDIEGAIKSIKDELPKLTDHHAKSLKFFKDNNKSIEDIDECVELLKIDRLRAEFQILFKEFLQSLDNVLPRREALKYIPDAKRLGYIHKIASQLYRTGSLNLIGVGKKVRDLIDEHIISQGIDPTIPPIDIMAADFEKHVSSIKSVKSQAAEMEYAARHHITNHLDEDPIYYKKLSERLEDILEKFADNWEELIKALKQFTQQVQAGRPADSTKLDPKKQAPFLSLLAEHSEIDLVNQAEATVHIVDYIKVVIARVDFWRNMVAQNELHGWIVEYLDNNNIVPFEKQEALADQFVKLARALHSRLVE